MGTFYLWNLEVWFDVPNVWEFHPLRMNLYMGAIMGGLIVAFVITSRILVCHGIIYRLHIVAVLSSGAILFFFAAYDLNTHLVNVGKRITI